MPKRIREESHAILYAMAAGQELSCTLATRLAGWTFPPARASVAALEKAGLIGDRDVHRANEWGGWRLHHVVYCLTAQGQEGVKQNHQTVEQDR